MASHDLHRAMRRRRRQILKMVKPYEPIKADDLAAHFGVSVRAIYRDLASLRGKIDTMAGWGGGIFGLTSRRRAALGKRMAKQ